MKLSKIIATLIAASLLAACNNSAEKKETPAEIKKDTVVEATKPPAAAFDTIELYHFKGNEPYINNDFIKGCTEQEKALLAYYCYFFNTSCADSKHCELTKALGLGEQNSKEHQKLVLKWFTDQETMQLAKEGGRITPNGAKITAWYEEIKLVKKGSLIVVRYSSAWKTSAQEGKGRGTDEYEFTPERVKVIGRQHEDI
jgi:hypothetical protein